ncbi:putative transcription factor interactor and regulator CCHC(Zn) family [Helianthus annuus]|nr:putative transcription factor interactor and regulator CCHC(Zn) family [Helianthus annuus]
MMISILQQAIKEDILILLQHNGSAHSMWKALKTKFVGSLDMIKNKKSLLKKEFYLFRGLKTENTKMIIERYCNLVVNMKRLDIKKDREEWVEKLADALPQDIWGTYLMILKNNGYCLYYKGSTVDKTNIAPKIETAFNANSSSGGSSQGLNNNNRFLSYPSFDPKFSATSNGQVLQCNIALHLQNGQNFSEEVAKGHMSLLMTVLESYESLVAVRIGNPMLTKEDYDQIDAEEMELMDIKWCMASVLRRAEKFKQITRRDDFRDAGTSPLGFDKSKVTCFRFREKGHFKRECTNCEASGAQNPFDNNDYHHKAIYHQVAPHQQQSSQTAHARKDLIEEPSKKAYLVHQDDERIPEGKMEEIKERQAAKKENHKAATVEENVRAGKKQVIEIPAVKVEKEADIEKISEKCENCDTVKRHNNKLIHNMNRLKESYDVLNKAMNQYNKSRNEQEIAMKTINGAFMMKQKIINQYIEKCAELEQKLETQRIETERVNRLLKSYSCASYVIDRIYPTVEGMEAFEKEKPEVKNTGKKHSTDYTRCPPPLEEGYYPRNPNSERVKKATNLKWESEPSDGLLDNIDVTFTSSDTNHESELIKKVVDQVLDKDETEESKSKSESETSSSSVNSSKSQVKRVYNNDFLISKNNLNDETLKVSYTLNDSDKLYSDEKFPIRSVKTEMIKKVFKLTEINISEIKDVNLTEKPKKYTSRVQQRLNKKKGYSPGSGYQKKPNHNSNFKKKGLGFIPPENYKNEKTYKPKTIFVSGASSEEEEKSSFWKQSNKELLAKKQEVLKNEANHKKETRTCYQCKNVGHIAWNCPMATNIKQEVLSKLKEKVVDKTEPPTQKFKVFKNSTFEVGASSKRFYKRKVDPNNHKWVVKKSDAFSGDESDSSKSEEPQVELKREQSVPTMDDANFPPLWTEHLKQKVGKVKISNQFFSEKKEFDVEKAFNPTVQNIFAKMVDGKVKGVKEFYEKNKKGKKPSGDDSESDVESESPKDR